MSIQPLRNGERVSIPNAAPVYLVLDGARHWIPNPTTYNNLFRDWNGIISSPDVNDIYLSYSLSDGAVLAKGAGDPVYLVSNGVKRWIISPSAMDKYHFNWDKIVQVPQVLLDGIQTGTNIE
ncbi:hypothetical protein BC937DRAFT_87519 [Endogone sp. FLAS-F59071]|nr:hypothetical protein BC937DRAFT_87519 [Endogone sp. FLAS-F59071]|eukprot:RUS19420.1 hypothetical protein BC937DRAFT_87519 [Endogone sp. FLAS-F59071]